MGSMGMCCCDLRLEFPKVWAGCGQSMPEVWADNFVSFVHVVLY